MNTHAFKVPLSIERITASELKENHPTKISKLSNKTYTSRASTGFLLGLELSNYLEKHAEVVAQETSH